MTSVSEVNNLFGLTDCPEVIPIDHSGFHGTAAGGK